MANHFTAIAPIWTKFFNGTIGMAERDRLLEPHRVQLRKDRVAARKAAEAHQAGVVALQEMYACLINDGLRRS